MERYHGPRHQIEKEPNNTSAQATNWNISQAVSGRLFITTDVDFYRITLDQAKTLDLTFNCPGSSKNFTLALYKDSDQNEINGINIVGGKTTTMPLGMDPGTYFLKVIGSGTSTETAYAYTLSLTESASQSEKEPNNTSPQATIWDISQAISGRLFSVSDVDFYRITIDQAKTLDLTFTCPGSSKNFTLTLYKDSDQSEINGINIVGGKTTSMPLGLDPGTYFLKVSGNGTNTETIYPYTLSLTVSTQTSMETEPNNAMPFANTLGNNVAKGGIIYNAQDKDIYGFYLPQEASFTVNFTATTTTGDYKVSVLDVQGNVLDWVCDKFMRAIFTPPHGAPKNLPIDCSEYCSAGR